VAREEVLEEQRDVVAAVAQRRQRDLEHVDPVEQVLAEPPGRDHGGEVAVRGRDDADVDLAGLGVADAGERALLEHAQHLDLERGRHVADLVEEERAVVGDLEQAGLVGDRAGERAAPVAEQLGVEQVVVERRAVRDDELAIAPRRGLVDRAGDELLPVPFSPWISTVDSDGAIRSSRS
jgi:hypothetical protein